MTNKKAEKPKATEQPAAKAHSKVELEQLAAAEAVAVPHGERAEFVYEGQKHVAWIGDDLQLHIENHGA